MRPLRSPITAALALALLVLFGTLTWRALSRDRSLRESVARLEADITRTEEENKELARLVDALGRPGYLEKEARTRLNLKRPEEEVLVLPAEPPMATTALPLPSPTPKPRSLFAPLVDFLTGALRLERNYEL